ncbi:hypothetical protein [Ralstonia phage phiRSL1]|uniref:Uncharacterized protein n=1 Tax=Ralstonia phage phiRSL1 TaxID=1980924 RepID=B2ZY84_9CAUD|nr:hypothetical protein RSL1_ORF272 [Ralstonia phage phiRSL1]BAG41719.1 hypothetical protein [Ralstonia phage phiRSL1]
MHEREARQVDVSFQELRRAEAYERDLIFAHGLSEDDDLLVGIPDQIRVHGHQISGRYEQSLFHPDSRMRSAQILAIQHRLHIRHRDMVLAQLLQRTPQVLNRALVPRRYIQVSRLCHIKSSGGLSGAHAGTQSDRTHVTHPMLSCGGPPTHVGQKAL